MLTIFVSGEKEVPNHESDVEICSAIANPPSTFDSPEEEEVNIDAPKKDQSVVQNIQTNVGDKEKNKNFRITKAIYTEIFQSGSMPGSQRFLVEQGWEKRHIGYLIILLIDVVLRGIAQVFLCNNPVSGIFICIGLLLTSGKLLGYALIGTTMSTFCAAFFGRPPRADVLAGLCGYDGALVGCACLVFLSPTYALQAAFLLSALSGVVHVACVNLLQTWNLPAFTFAFNITMIFFLSAAKSGSIQLQLITPSVVTYSSNWNTMSGMYVLDASLRGVGQFMFVDTTLGGAFVVAGIAISSRKGACMALLGSIIGWIMARYVLHASAENIIRAGIFGYNGAGTCSALSGGIFYKVSDGAVVIGVLGSILGSLLMVGILGFLDGLPVLTFPFILSTWVMMLSRTKLLTGDKSLISTFSKSFSQLGEDSPVRKLSKAISVRGRMVYFSPTIAQKKTDFSVV